MIIDFKIDDIIANQSTFDPILVQMEGEIIPFTFTLGGVTQTRMVRIQAVNDYGVPNFAAKPFQTDVYLELVLEDVTETARIEAQPKRQTEIVPVAE